MIKAIIFDNGGVLVEDTWLDYLLMASSRMGVTKDEFLLGIREFTQQTLRGEINVSEFLVKLRAYTGFDEGIEKMMEIPALYSGSEDWLQDLKQRGFILAMLSNDFGNFSINDSELWHYERFFEDRIYYSSVIGEFKPHPGAFHFVIDKLGLEPSEVVFIDDKLRNTDAASELGMNVIQFTSQDQAKQELEAIIERENAKK